MSIIAGLFPGQGSQQVGMGHAFFNNSEAARELFERANKALGLSLSELCFQGPIEKLTLTEFAQPALLTASYIAYCESTIEISAAAGHSLGEYTALLVAGCIDFENAVQLVNKRGKYMQEAVPSGEGKMIAVLGPSEEEINTNISKVEDGVAEIANLNSPGQTVIAGDLRGINTVSELMRETGAKVIPLNVSAPFHCRLMKSAEEQLTKDLDAITFNDPSIVVYSNVKAQGIKNGIEARELLKKQVCSSVRWSDQMKNMITEQQITHTVEFGAGGVLSKLLKRIDKTPQRLEVFDPESLQKAKQAL